MTKQKLTHYASSVLVKAINTDKFFFGGYDEGYPEKRFRNCYNLIGGLLETTDKTPRDTLNRELTEELSVLSEERHLFAPEELVVAVRNRIIGTSQPSKDYLFTGVNPKDPSESRIVLNSVHTARISDELMDYLQQTIASGKRFTTEGIVGVASLDELISGKAPLAWETPSILSDLLGVPIPNPHQIATHPLTPPIRERIEDYFSDFDFGNLL